jgi:hypothetical protein
MATEIKVWQVFNDELRLIETTMEEANRREATLQQWIRSNPEILGEDILIIGEQVRTKSGSIDFLGIDSIGNLVIIELKRDKLPREVLAQAIDYASDVSTWDRDKINDICQQYTRQDIENYLTENLKVEDEDIENLSINQEQRILLVGFSVEEQLQRMIEWLSENYGVRINVVVLKYIKTHNEEFIARTVIIPEEIENERSKKRQMQIQMSDKPGKYENTELETRLIDYLSQNKDTPRWIRKILLPLCLQNETVTREMIKNKLIQEKEANDEGKAGRILTVISKVIGLKENDFLRQIIRYNKSNSEKENYRIPEEYRKLVENVLAYLEKQNKND